MTTHAEHSAAKKNATPCTAHDLTYGGRCLACGFEPESEPRIYRIIRFRFLSGPRTLRRNVTLTEARAHCSRPDTSSHSTGPRSWFDGYDYMAGCRPKE